MLLFKMMLAALPALAVAQEPVSTTIQTSTTVLTKTIVISHIQTVTSAQPNGTASHMPTVGTTSYFTALSVSPTGLPVSPPPMTETVNAAGSLSAARVALAGLAGVVAVAFI